MNIWVDLPVTLIILILGASVGSFLNVVIYRLPAGLSLLLPSSHCPHCHTQLKAYENVPILGWLWLRGRCRHCKSRISPRYLLVEVATGILFLCVFWVFGVSEATLGCWLFLSWLLALSLIDLDTMTLPNQLTQSGLVAGLVFQAISGFLPSFSGVSLVNQLLAGIMGAVLGIWLLDIITLLGSIILGQVAMGGGDAKLAAMIGAWLGWKLLLVAFFLACTVGAVVGGGAIALGWLNRRQPIPFGPFLALGAILAAFGGEAILLTYLQWFWSIN